MRDPLATLEACVARTNAALVVVERPMRVLCRTTSRSRASIPRLRTAFGTRGGCTRVYRPDACSHGLVADRGRTTYRSKQRADRDVDRRRLETGTVSHSVVTAIDGLRWQDDRVLIGDDLVLRLQNRPDDPELEVASLAFYKSRPLVDEYRRFYAARPEFVPTRIFELGIWDGGSTVFWHEVLRPEKLIAVDIGDREDDPLFVSYLAARGASGQVETHWRTDQQDTSRLVELAGTLGGPLDLVIDDASHLYGPTRASFEALFPLLRPGGMYVIEDWPWAHLAEYRSDDHPWRDEPPLTRLIHDLVELQGSAPGLAAGLTVNYAFAAVERGAAAIEPTGAFTLAANIVRSE